MVAVFLGAGLDALQVGAGARLGHGDGADQLAGGQLRQPLLFLLLRAVMQDVWRDDGIVQADAEAVDADMADRLDDGALMREGAARTAVLFGHRSAEQACGARLQPALAVDHLVLLELVVARRDLLRHEAGRHVVEHADLVRRPGGLRQAKNFGWICRHDFLRVPTIVGRLCRPAEPRTLPPAAPLACPRHWKCAPDASPSPA